ncbi:Polysialic acid transport protein KpsM [Roseovarius albus]|uniref:Polysialic acid transport protein KpsM n=1 Tax=Roseovarius albus TaxID=1247867 RepID=A0A1X6YTL6_9RHOB|nr:ABC transporter permease [Roseovarius albus]SLN30271.1 Polysialic acid transport protein KpsM [Roseovarius albus]
MFETRRPSSRLRAAAHIADLVFLETSNQLRKGHKSAFVSLAINIMQSVALLAAFYVTFTLLGLKGANIRGDFLIYLMSGIMLYISHIKTVSAISGAASASNEMLKHAPMQPIILIISAALGALYIQVLSIFIVLFFYYVLITPFEIDQPVMAFFMFILAWFTGIGVGLILLALKPWAPKAVQVFQLIYTRANMIGSGKMFVANSLPLFMLSMFDWNPLFHVIDQCRGFIFINYFPRNSSLEYPFIVSIALIVIGMMGEFYTRQYDSQSWYAAR